MNIVSAAFVHELLDSMILDIIKQFFWCGCMAFDSDDSFLQWRSALLLMDTIRDLRLTRRSRLSSIIFRWIRASRKGITRMMPEFRRQNGLYAVRVPTLNVFRLSI